MQIHAPERIIPAQTSSGPLASHLVRYAFAAPHCKDKLVLDAACGVGYGTARLARDARRVVGVDRAPEAIAYARTEYAVPTARFALADAHVLPFGNNVFDVVVSFETLEHLPRPDDFLAETARVLRPGGMLILSTPRVARTRRNPPENPYHVVEYSVRDLERVLARSFGNIETYGQTRKQSRLHRWLQRIDPLKLRTHVPKRMLAAASRAAGTVPWEETDMSGFDIVRGQLQHASEIVAVCREPRK